MDNNKVYIGQRLRALREDHGWSLADVAQFTNIPLSSIAAYERDDTIIPADRLAQLARLYRVSADYVLSGAQDGILLQRQWPVWFQLSMQAFLHVGQDNKQMLIDILRYLLEDPSNIAKVSRFIAQARKKP